MYTRFRPTLLRKRHCRVMSRLRRIISSKLTCSYRTVYTTCKRGTKTLLVPCRSLVSFNCYSSDRESHRPSFLLVSSYAFRVRRDACLRHNLPWLFGLPAQSLGSKATKPICWCFTRRCFAFRLRGMKDSGYQVVSLACHDSAVLKMFLS